MARERVYRFSTKFSQAFSQKQGCNHNFKLYLRRELSSVLLLFEIIICIYFSNTFRAFRLLLNLTVSFFLFLPHNDSAMWHIWALVLWHLCRNPKVAQKQQREPAKKWLLIAPSLYGLPKFWGHIINFHGHPLDMCISPSPTLAVC